MTFRWHIPNPNKVVKPSTFHLHHSHFMNRAACGTIRYSKPLLVTSSTSHVTCKRCKESIAYKERTDQELAFQQKGH